MGQGKLRLSTPNHLPETSNITDPLEAMIAKGMKKRINGALEEKKAKIVVESDRGRKSKYDMKDRRKEARLIE